MQAGIARDNFGPLHSAALGFNIVSFTLAFQRNLAYNWEVLVRWDEGVRNRKSK